MPHFATPFHVTPVEDKGLIRLSVRGSENHVREHWLEPWEVRSALEGEDHSTWTGEGRIQIKVHHPAGSVALVTNGARDVIRTTRGNTRMLMAQLRGAIKSLGEVVSTKESEPQLDQLRTELGRVALQNRESEARIMVVLEQVLGTLSQIQNTTPTVVVQGSTTPGPVVEAETPEEEPLFIPSPDLNIEGSISASESSTAGIDDAVKALKEIK
jgi:hypothetical protein